jgi:hypothetical protein
MPSNATISTAYGTPVSGFFVLLFPLILIFTALSYKKYQKQRARDRAFTLLQQVARLEAMWHIKPPR